MKLRKPLYGLKESPRCWNEKLNEVLTKNGFTQSHSDFCLYTSNNVYVLIFVDDILIIGNAGEIRKKLRKEYQAKYLGNISKLLGMEIKRIKTSIIIKQTEIIDKILLKFNMQDCKGISTPMEVGLNITKEEILLNIPYRELIGSLMYLATTSRPDIAYATAFLSRYMHCPTSTLWSAGKRILRYLKQTIEKGLVYKKQDNNVLHSFSDADWGGIKDDHKSLSGYAIFHCDNLISWSSKKQSTVALSTAEFEYVAAALTVSETVFIIGVIKDLKGDNDLCSYLLIDNQSTIKMIERYENSKRSKHINIKVHFIKDIVSKGLLLIKYVTSNENTADILTKPMPKARHNYLCELLCLY